MEEGADWVGSPFPLEMEMTKDAIKRAVSAALGGAEISETYILPQVCVLPQADLGGTSYGVGVRYVLQDASEGRMWFMTTLTVASEGIVYTFQASPQD